MKYTLQTQVPTDADVRKAIEPVICSLLKVDVYRPDPTSLTVWVPTALSAYSRGHGV